MKSLHILVFLLFIPITFLSHSTETLDDDEGLAIVAIYSKGYAEKIKLDGPGFGNDHNFGPLLNSQYFEVQKLKEGVYSWDEVILKAGENLKSTSDLSHLNLEFTITPGKLNYIGLFMYESNGSTYSAKIVNRTSIVLSILKQDFPQYIDMYPLANGIYPDDQYIEFFLNGSKSISSGK